MKKGEENLEYVENLALQLMLVSQRLGFESTKLKHEPERHFIRVEIPRDDYTVTLNVQGSWGYVYNNLGAENQTIKSTYFKKTTLTLEKETATGLPSSFRKFSKFFNLAATRDDRKSELFLEPDDDEEKKKFFAHMVISTFANYLEEDPEAIVEIFHRFAEEREQIDVSANEISAGVTRQLS